eukprot:40548_1
MNMFVWNCKKCNCRNSITRQKCSSCGNRINGEFIIEPIHSNVVEFEGLYFYRNDPSKPANGPVDVEQLRILYLSKTINDDTFVWNANLIKFTRLNKINHLYSKIKQMTPNKITFRQTIITTDQIPKYDSNRRLSIKEMNEIKNNINKQMQILIEDPKAAIQRCSKVKVEETRNSAKLNQTKPKALFGIISRKKRYRNGYKTLLPKH